MNYSFVWIANTLPWLVSPDGDPIDLEVHGNIPFLRIGNASEEAMVAQAVPRILTTQADPDESEDNIAHQLRSSSTLVARAPSQR